MRTEPKKQSAKEIFSKALEYYEPKQWEGYVADACKGNEPLRERVRELLRAHQEGDSLLDRETGNASKPVISERPGSMIGSYKLLQQIGEGGFGVVYMAEQLEPVRRKVALKIIKPGMDSKQVIARFEAERQALAMMDHPNIAKVLDAGATDSGRPYFVMELVKGIPVTKFCDTNNLSTADRLHLFVTICNAVQHAHQKGVIHRDIKPSNVLVTLKDNRAMPVVIDFGVSKAISQQLTDKTLFTAFGQMVGTPVYMSPEQAQMTSMDVDTRSDIYSLGVLLYELLTGVTPLTEERLRSTAYAEVQRLISEEEAPRPSTRLSTLGASLPNIARNRATDPKKLVHYLRGDLDWIVLKALEKDRARRYDSAAAFAIDVQRHLRDEAVEAAAPSMLYQFSRFSRRHRGILSAVAAVFVSLVLGVIGMSWLYVRAETASQRAQQQSIEADQQRVRAEIALTAATDERQRAILAQGNAEKAQQSEEKQRKRAEDAARLASDAQSIAEGEAERTRQLLYSTDMQLASHLWNADSGSVGTIDRILMSHIPLGGQTDLRDFAWRYQWNQLYRTALFDVSLGNVSAIGFTPEGNTLTCDASMRIKKWEIGNPEPVRAQVIASMGELHKLLFSPDGSKLAAVTKDFQVTVFDVATGQVHMEQDERYPSRAVAFSADSSHLLVSAGHLRMRRPRILIWHLDSKEVVVQRLHRAAMGKFLTRLSPDHSRVASAGNGSVVVHTNESLDPLLLKGHVSTVHDAAWSPDGHLIASGDSNGKIFVWDLDDADKNRNVNAHSSIIRAITYSADGTQLASGGDDGVIRVWDASTMERTRQLKGHGAGIRDLVFSPDGKRLGSVDANGSAKAWDLESDMNSPLYAAKGKRHRRLAVSPDGNWLATAVDNRTLFWNLATGQVVNEFDHSCYCLSFSPDSSVVAASTMSRELQLIRLDTFEADRSLPVGMLAGAIEFSPDGRFLTLGEGQSFIHGRIQDRAVEVWDVEAGKRVHSLRHHMQSVTSLDFSPDGGLLASASHDGTVAIWNAENWTLERVLEEPGTGFVSVSFTPDGSLLAGGARNGNIHIWESSSGRRRHTFEGHGHWVADLEFSPTGRALASASWDQTIKLWNLASTQETRTLRGHTDWINGLAFSADGNNLFSSSSDGTIRRWEASPLTEIDTAPATHQSLQRLGELNQERADHRSAERLFRKVAELRTKQLGASDPQTLDVHKRIGAALFAQERFEEAAAEWIHVLELTLDVDDGNDTDALNSLVERLKESYARWAATLHSLGQVKEATVAYQVAIAETKRLLGSGHLSTATHQHASALLLREQGELPSAVEHHRASLSTRRHQLPAHDPLIATSLYELAITRIAQGQATIARTLLQEAVDIRREHREVAPDKLAQTLIELAKLWRDSDTEAGQRNCEVLCEEAYQLKTSPTQQRAAEILVEYFSRRQMRDEAEIWQARGGISTGDYAMARALLEGVASRRDETLGSDHAKTKAVRQTLLSINAPLADQAILNGDYDEALARLKPYVDSYPDAHQAAFRLAILYAHCGDTEAHGELALQIAGNAEGSEEFDLVIQAAKACLLMNHPADSEVIRRGVALSRVAEKLKPESLDAWLAIVMAETRAGRFAQADVWARRVLRQSEYATALGFSFVALTHANGGRPRRSRQALKMASDAADRLKQESSDSADSHWRDLLVQVVQAEAKATPVNDKSILPTPSPLTPQFPVTTDSIPPRSPDASQNQIDLSDDYNAAISQSWLSRDPDDGVGLQGLRAMPRGLQTLNGIEFDIRGAIQLGGRGSYPRLLDYPDVSAPIQIDRNCEKLHFLHALVWGSRSEGEPVGTIEIHYEDEETETIQLTYAGQCLDWWVKDGDPELSDPDSQVAWQGKSESGQQLRVFQTAWTNPRPDQQVDYVVIRNTRTWNLNVRLAPFLLAISTE